MIQIRLKLKNVGIDTVSLFSDSTSKILTASSDNVYLFIYFLFIPWGGNLIVISLKYIY